MLTDKTCRAARALVGLTQEELADRSNVGRSTVKSFENGQRTPHANNLAALQVTLEAAGVSFIAADNQGGVGVRLKLENGK